MDRGIPYGSWPSPVTASAAAAASPRIEGARFVRDELWWGESVPEEGGRTTVRRRRPDGVREDLLPPPWSARSRVHEYGGGSWTVSDDGTLYFVEQTDQRVWALTPGDVPKPRTAADDGARYGGLSWQEGRLLAIREIHGSTAVPRRDVVTVATEGHWRVIDMTVDTDFVAQPALSPGGHHLAWIAWNHPDMPWDRTELRVGRLEGGTVTEWTTVTSGETSALQPMWVDADDLLYADDPTGRWNIWRMRLDAGLDHEDVAPADADTGGPLWVLGARWFAPLVDGRIVAIRTNGTDDVVVIEPRSGDVRSLGVEATANVVIEDVSGTRLLISGSGAASAPAIWVVDMQTGDSERVAGAETPWGHEWMPRARAVTFDGDHGPVHAFDYPPTNPEVSPTDRRAAPIPRARARRADGARCGSGIRARSPTSRAVASGCSMSTTEARPATAAHIASVCADDGESSTWTTSLPPRRGLVAEGRADAARLAIEGGSAGGWTVLAALVGTDVYSAGISRYGVGDARALAAETHDFEAHYLDGLIGPLPQDERVYIERSPLSRADQFRVPLLLLQGAEDEVVPPAQSEAIRDALAARGIPHAYVVYEGEGHGFRRGETVVDALEKELAFLGEVFGFDTPDVPPIRLD